MLIRRYENKYLISEAQCEALAEMARIHCDIDPFCVGKEGEGYTIHSLYFDTPMLDFYEAKDARELDRFKPRVRFYGHTPSDPLFLEVKRKVNGIVLKTRSKGKLEHWPAVLEDAVLAASLPPDDKRDNFIEKMLTWGAIPVVHIRYRREAYMSRVDRYARVTFDRELVCAPARGSWSLAVPPEEWLPIDDPASCHTYGSPVILELKCEDQVPVWLVEIIRAFNLKQTAFSKYGKGVDRILNPLGVHERRVFRKIW